MKLNRLKLNAIIGITVLALAQTTFAGTYTTTNSTPWFNAQDPGFSSQITVSSEGAVLSGISVQLNVTGSLLSGYDDIFLESPNGGQFILINTANLTNGCNISITPTGNDLVDNYLNYSPTFATNGQLLGAWSGYQSIQNQAGLNWARNGALVGSDPNGVWTLYISSTQPLANPNEGDDPFLAYGNNPLAVISWGLVLNSIASPTVNSIMTLGVDPGKAVTISAGKILSNCSDTNGYVLSISAATATNGVAGIVNAEDVRYAAPLVAGNDSISYTVSDGHGGTATGQIAVTIRSPGPAFNQLSLAPLNDGSGGVVATFLGVPGYSYVLQWTPSLAPPIQWTDVETNVAASNGFLQFTNYPTGEPGEANFFRTRSN
jgi:hypothetical protein